MMKYSGVDTCKFQQRQGKLGAMRRVLVACVLLVVALQPAPAQADSIVIVHSTNFPPTYGIGVFGCGSDPFDVPTVSSSQGFLGIQPGPGTPPAGTHSWAFDGVGGDAGGPLAFPSDPMKDIGTAEAWFYSTGTDTGYAWAFYEEPTDATAGNGKIWLGRSAIALAQADTSTWTKLGAIGRSYDWTKYQAGQNGYQPTGDPSVLSTTVPTFADAHGTTGLGGYALVMGCGGGKVDFDKFVVGKTGNITTYDFEELTTVTTMTTASSTILAGRSKVLGGKLVPAFPDAPMRLEAKKFGSTTWTLVAAPHTGSEGGTVSFTVKPLTQTSYRWVFAGSSSASGSVSKAITINVKLAVTAQPVAKVVTLGKAIKITGKVTPAKPGHLVTLWKKTATGKVKLGTAIIRSDGTYVASTKATKVGTWKLLVTVPAQSGNLAGTSPTVSVSVVR
jgi:hypothetical protein